MVSEADVEMAYRLILGRQPDSAEILAHHAQNYADLNVMRSRFLRSPEFQQSLIALQAETTSHLPQIIRPWNEPPAQIETDIAPDLAEQLTRHVEQTWTKLGETEPHWSVLTHEAFRPEKIGQNEKAFYDSGETPVAMFLRALGRSGIDVSSMAEQTCLELGCGVGRITLPLARRFERVVAVDISPAHLAIAERAMLAADRHNVDFVQLTSPRLIRDLPRVDAFISIIVLQHNPPPLMKMLLESCLQRLRPNGVGYFQLPYHIPGYGFNAAAYLKHITRSDASQTMEMHVLPQPVVFDVVRQSGCQVLEVREDGWCGEGIYSGSFLVQRI